MHMQNKLQEFSRQTSTKTIPDSLHTILVLHYQLIQDCVLYYLPVHIATVEILVHTLSSKQQNKLKPLLQSSIRNNVRSSVKQHESSCGVSS